MPIAILTVALVVVVGSRRTVRVLREVARITREQRRIAEVQRQAALDEDDRRRAAPVKRPVVGFRVP